MQHEDCLKQIAALATSVEQLERRLVARIEQRIHEELIQYTERARHAN